MRYRIRKPNIEGTVTSLREDDARKGHARQNDLARTAPEPFRTGIRDKLLQGVPEIRFSAIGIYPPGYGRYIHPFYPLCKPTI